MINRDRMWHYTEGITSDPIWRGCRIIQAVVAIFRCRGQAVAGYRVSQGSTPSALESIAKSGHDYTWSVLCQDNRRNSLSVREQDLT